MAGSGMIERRLRSHLLSAPASSIVDAARHMLAVQGQDFAGGRWALAVRTRPAPGLSEVDAAFAAGALVRSWTMRGTLHIVAAADLRWILAVTGGRQQQRAAPVLQREGIDAAELSRAEASARNSLRGGGRLTRDQLGAVWEADGIATHGQRGYHLLSALAVRGILCLGPVVERPSAVTREQYVVLVDDLAAGEPPADPLAELFTGYIRGHGPATARDFAWWVGLPLGVARDAAARAAPRLQVFDEGVETSYVDPGTPPARPDAHIVHALPPFDEYYLSYDDRTTVCAPPVRERVGPSKNGMVRAILIAGGRVVGTWAPARGEAGVELFDGGAGGEAAVSGALARHRAFLTG